MDVGCRPATPDDHDSLHWLATRAIELQVEKRGGELWARTTSRAVDADASLRTDVADDDVHVVLGTIDDAGVGYGVAHLQLLTDGSRLAVVTDLYVDPEARGVGVGEAVMDELIAWATEKGCFGIDSHALPGDRHTKNFFESFGLVARSLTVHRELGQP